MSKQLILASQSPRRAELLTLMGYTFTAISADVDESALSDESPEALVARLAQLKAQTISNQLDRDILANSVILASDTVVVKDDKVMGKPQDLTDFRAMMSILSGNTHQVMTAIGVVSMEQEKTQTISTEVTFCQLSEKDIQGYWQSGEPQDKAGGYGIQGIGGQFVKSIKGSYSAVVGLPMVETRQLLAEFGVMQ